MARKPESRFENLIENINRDDPAEAGGIVTITDIAYAANLWLSDNVEHYNGTDVLKLTEMILCQLDRELSL